MGQSMTYWWMSALGIRWNYVRSWHAANWSARCWKDESHDIYTRNHFSLSSFKDDCYRCTVTPGKTHSVNSYLSHKGFCVLQDRYEGDLQERGEKLHLDQLLPGAGKGEHGWHTPDHQVLAGTTGQWLRVPSRGRSSHHFQAQVVGQQRRWLRGCCGGVCPSALMPEAGQGAVERVLYPCRLSGRQERTETHGVSYPGENVARLWVREAGVRGGRDG